MCKEGHAGPLSFSVVKEKFLIPPFMVTSLRPQGAKKYIIVTYHPTYPGLVHWPLELQLLYSLRTVRMTEYWYRKGATSIDVYHLCVSSCGVLTCGHLREFKLHRTESCHPD